MVKLNKHKTIAFMNEKNVISYFDTLIEGNLLFFLWKNKINCAKYDKSGSYKYDAKNDKTHLILCVNFIK